MGLQIIPFTQQKPVWVEMRPGKLLQLRFPSPEEQNLVLRRCMKEKPRGAGYDIDLRSFEQEMLKLGVLGWRGFADTDLVTDDDGVLVEVRERPVEFSQDALMRQDSNFRLEVHVLLTNPSENLPKYCKPKVAPAPEPTDAVPEDAAAALADAPAVVPTPGEAKNG